MKSIWLLLLLGSLVSCSKEDALSPTKEPEFGYHVPQGDHDYDIRIVEQRVGKTIAKSSYNFKRFLDMGISLSNGSDCPVELPDVMKGIQCAVTRKSLDGVWGPYLPDQALTVKEALDSYTIGGAYASFEENQKGDIKEGMLADFVILGENPFEVESNAISDIPVLETWVNGICVYKNPLK